MENCHLAFFCAYIYIADQVISYTLLIQSDYRVPIMLADAWTHTPESALDFYGTNVATGLSDGEVTKNREKYGENCECSFKQ